MLDANKPHGWDAELPLHWAISERAPLFIIEALLDIYPEGYLFLFLYYFQIKMIINELIYSNLGARSKGRYGALPLWYALETDGRDELDLTRLIEILLKLHPQGFLSISFFYK